jgi:hypothetical protein
LLTVAVGADEVDVVEPEPAGLPYGEVPVVLTEPLADEEGDAVELPLATITPPPTVGGLVVKVVFMAFALKAARVFPDAGSLITPTIPDWQW